nr:MAG TPA: hypothetical protein [Caudoviricetes sp.]
MHRKRQLNRCLDIYFYNYIITLIECEKCESFIVNLRKITHFSFIFYLLK